MGPGSVLGGRYVLRRRLDDAVETSTWQAHDETLDRLVHLRVVAVDHPRGEAVLDAARRAAAVEDARLERVLDVGHDDEVTFVVSEWLAADSLEARLRGGPLTADAARTVVGEVALALEAARHRGLHHLRLSPRTVRVLDDGGVKVTDLATAAALDGVEVGTGAGELSSEEATELDTRDLVAVAYAALTATWPLPDRSDLPAAPLVSGKPAAPAQVVTGAPADLDTLCAQTFAGAGAPDSPGDLARQIAPWGRQRQVERATGTFPHLLPPTRRAPLPTATPPASGGASPSTSIVPAPPPPPAPSPLAAIGVLQGLGTGGDDLADDLVEDPDGDARAGRDVVPGGRQVEPSRERPQSRSATVLVLVGGFVAVFLLLAYCGLRGLGQNAFVPSPRTASTSPSATGTPGTAPTSSPPTATTPPAAAVLRVTSARGFDPQGDGGEKDDKARLAVDGKTSTAWVSDTYKTAQFGGLKKGLGLLLNLDGEQLVTQVRVRLGAGGATLQLRTANGESLGRVLASASDAAGTVTLRPAAAVRTSNLVIWFTVPAQVDGGYRAEVAEVVVQ